MPFLESSFGVLLRGNAGLGGLTHSLLSNFKDLMNVHGNGLVFLFLLLTIPFNLGEIPSGVTLPGPRESKISYSLIPSPANQSLGT